MSDAVIIPFPAPRQPAHSRAGSWQVDALLGAPMGAPVREAVVVDNRLADALAGLQNALAEQAQAVRAWRFAMAELDIGVAGLGQAMAAYDGSLSQLDQQLLGLRHNAEMLAAQADRALHP